MKIFFTQYLKDFKSHFNHLNSFVVFGCYLIISTFAAIYLGDYFLRESSIINSYLIMQPITLMLTIPAITMHVWSDEIKSGTLELLLTQPIGYSTLVLAKFFATYTFFCIMITFSLPFLFVTKTLAIIDYGAVFLGYCAVFLCGALYIASGCLISSLCRNTVVSYIFTIFIIFCILQIEFGSISCFGHVITFEFLNFENNYDALLSGMFYWGNIAYFIISTILIIWLNIIVISIRKYDNYFKKKSFLIFISLLFIIFSSSILGIGYILDTPKDITDNQRFMITESSQKFLRDIDKRINITLYENQNKREEANSSYAVYAEYVERILKLIEKFSNRAVRTEFVRVEPFSAKERELIHSGVPFVEDSVGNKVFMKADISDNDGNLYSINSFDNLRQEFLETDIMRLIYRFAKPKKEIAIIASLDEFSQMKTFQSLLNEFYSVSYFDSFVSFIPPVYDAVVVINPVSVPSEFLLAMEQYVLHGGTLIVFYEPSLMKATGLNTLKPFLEGFGFNAVIDGSPHNSTSVDSLSVLKPSLPGYFKDVRSVIVNDAGKIRTYSSKNYIVKPILSMDDEVFAAISEGTFASNYLSLAAQTRDIEPVSVKPGKVLFFYDSDVLKDYLFVSQNSKSNNFYEAVPIDDNLVFLLNLFDFALDEQVETKLSYRRYVINVSSIGDALYNSVKERYAEKLDTLQKKLDKYKNQQTSMQTILAQKGFSSIKDIGNFGDISQQADEVQDEINKLKSLLANDYQTLVFIITAFLVLIFPLISLLLLAIVLIIFRKLYYRKIRRLLTNAQTN